MKKQNTETNEDGGKSTRFALCFCLEAIASLDQRAGNEMNNFSKAWRTNSSKTYNIATDTKIAVASISPTKPCLTEYPSCR
jgi:hypothetical protein